MGDYAYIEFERDGVFRIFRTNDYWSIYNYAINYVEHDEAENIASWAENAYIGETYCSDEFDNIEIVEE